MTAGIGKKAQKSAGERRQTEGVPPHGKHQAPAQHAPPGAGLLAGGADLFRFDEAVTEAEAE
tara:strand:+ start:3658 stop:3843 length:186 start_codon:yes stop_codon:yes gene_type:complete